VKQPATTALVALLAAVATDPAARGNTSVPARLPAGATELAFRVHDAATGDTMPCELVLVAAPRTRPLVLRKRNPGRFFGDAVLAGSRVFSASGSGRVPVPPGTYDVWVGRGPEWTAERRRIELHRGETASIEVDLAHVVDTSGWVSTDFHVHAAPSRDSVIPLDGRAMQAAAVGLDFLIGGDHNHVTDYGPVIARRSLGAWLGHGLGYELTTQRWGHFGVFPLPAAAAGKMHDKLPIRGPGAGQFFEQLRAWEPDAIVIVHHPLSLTDSYFRVGGLDLAHHRGRRGFSFGFDAVEIVNGYSSSNYRQLRDTLRLWFDLIDQGYRVTGVGDSDSHDLRARRGLAGFPRTWVQVADDRPAEVTPGAIAAGVKAGHALVSTGPFVRVSIGEAVAGDLVRARGGRVRLAIDVQAAPWVPVARVSVYVDGRLDRTYPVAPTTGVTRFRAEHPLALARDAYVVVVVEGDRPLPPLAGEPHSEIPALAVTNPIYLDVDGNGVFDPSMRRPLSPVSRSVGWPAAGRLAHTHRHDPAPGEGATRHRRHRR